MSNQEQGTATDEGGRSWAAARAMEERLSGYHMRVDRAIADALAQAEVPQDVRKQVHEAVWQVQRDLGDVDHLWTLALPEPRPVDALDLMRWRVVVPASAGEAAALEAVVEVLRRLHEHLLECAKMQTAQEAAARAAQDAKRAESFQLRAAIYDGTAELVADFLREGLDIWDQYNLAERRSEVISIGASSGAPTAPPPLDLGDLHDPRVTSREHLLKMVEQACAVRAQLAWTAVRRVTDAEGSGGSLRPEEDRAAAIAMAQAADLLEAGLAAGAGRYEELGRHVAAHGRCLDQVI